MNKLNKQIITGMLGLFALAANGAETGGSDSSYVTTLSNWSIEPTRSCNTFTVSLPSPTLDIGCNLDNDSGNPSTWFNPLASCDLNFDMIGLPTLGDIAAGLTGAICGEIQELKEKTIDQVISEINNQIPDQIFDNINLGGNVNDRLNSGTGSDGTPTPPSVGNGGTEPTPTEPELCYTRDSSGNTITVPCEIAEVESPYDNVCYRKDSAMSNDWNVTACDRPIPEFEYCVTGYQYKDRDDDNFGSREIKYWPNSNVPMVETDLCGNVSASSNLGNACVYKSGMAECSRITDNPTQHQRACSVTNTSTGFSETDVSACINVEQTCYGFIGGVFKADSCKNHTLNYLTSSAQPQSTQSNSVLQGESNDNEYQWEW